jgi:curved DNA-binding protein CbpA
MSRSGEFIFSWLQVLDQLTYYELFGIQETAGGDEIRIAFHRFCDTFHPDRHSARSQSEREALTIIFKRGTEAHLVLSDPGLREHYNREIGASRSSTAASVRPPRISYSPRTRATSAPPGPVKLEDAVRSPSSRPFARRAEELIANGDLRQAKLQLVMANHLDPKNEALEAALRDVEAKLLDRNW